MRSPSVSIQLTVYESHRQAAVRQIPKAITRREQTKVGYKEERKEGRKEETRYVLEHSRICCKVDHDRLLLK